MSDRSWTLVAATESGERQEDKSVLLASHSLQLPTQGLFQQTPSPKLPQSSGSSSLAQLNTRLYSLPSAEEVSPCRSSDV